MSSIGMLAPTIALSGEMNSMSRLYFQRDKQTQNQSPVEE